MINNIFVDFHHVYVFDFEFIVNDGERPDPVCLVAKELKSGTVERVWLEGDASASPPYPLDSKTLFIAYYASAEVGCHLSLGWPPPQNLIDLFAEFRNTTNGLNTIAGKSLLGAMTYYGLKGISMDSKDTMREIILRGGPRTKAEQEQIIYYCQSDVEATASLFNVMANNLDFTRALLRGRYMTAVAHMEHNGIPIDVTTLSQLKANWAKIQKELVTAVDKDYGVYEGMTFKLDKFAKYLNRNNIQWPLKESGNLNLQDEIFKEMALKYPVIQPLREVRKTLSKLRLNDLAVGSDGRNRCLLSPFKSKTGRNQPSNAKFIFGPAKWLRFLIKPEVGRALAYSDWCQQEFGIAAALSKDKAMKEAYQSGDPYLTFAKQAGAVPEDATQKSHPNERENFKACVLAVNYGMGKESLAKRINDCPAKARELIEAHKNTYKTFWSWVEGIENCAMQLDQLWTVFGWTFHVQGEVNPRMLKNFPVQANGAEMLRIACIMAEKENIKICAPVHDAVLIESTIDEIENDVSRMQQVMAGASEVVLSGFRLRTDAEVFKYPARYYDERGAEMWDKVQEVLNKLLKGAPEWDG